MSWLARLLRVASKAPLQEVLDVVSLIAEHAKGNRGVYRQLLAEAANKGDLDAPLDAFRRANGRAEDYIEEG